MRRPTFLEGAGFALAVAVAGGVAFVLLVPVFAGVPVLKAVVAAATLAYLLYLLARSGTRAGRVTAVAAWALATAAAWWFAPSLLLYLLAQAGFAWLVRSLLFHGGVLAALADLGLTALGLAAAGWALARTGSVGAALWCYFLVAALFVAIPARFPRRAAQGDDGDPDRFQQAHRTAETALRELSVRH
jgi:hypothetical protein